MHTPRRSWIYLSFVLIGALLLASCGGTPTAAPPAPTQIIQPTEAPTAVPPTAVPPTAVPPTTAPTTAPAATAAPAPTFAAISKASGHLVMLDWAGYDTPDYWAQFAQEYPNVKVDYSFLGNSGDAYTKLQSAFNADLVHPCSNYWKLLVDEKLVPS